MNVYGCGGFMCLCMVVCLHVRPCMAACMYVCVRLYCVCMVVCDRVWSNGLPYGSVWSCILVCVCS